jgi:nucleoside-diphosphate-sugar epimerase
MVRYRTRVGNSRSTAGGLLTSDRERIVAMPNQKDTVLITGACGLLGSAMTRRLADRYDVIGFDIVESPRPLPFSAYHQVDLTSDDSVRRGMEQVRNAFGDELASVIHLAAYYSFSGGSSELYEQVTVQGTRRLLRALQNCSVRQFVFSSTMLVHEPTRPGEKINEQSKLGSKWDYPQSKERTEAFIRRERGNISSVIARVAGVYDDECHSIPIAHQIQRIYERQMTARFYPGAMDRGQAFVHLDDVVDAFVLMVERREQLPPEEVFLIGEGTTLSYDHLQRRLGELIQGKEWGTLQIPKPIAKTGAWLQEKTRMGDPFIKPWMIDLADDHYELDISHATTQLGWVPQRSLDETLPRMVQGLKDDPLAWYRKNKLELPPALEPKAV